MRSDAKNGLGFLFSTFLAVLFESKTSLPRCAKKKILAILAITKLVIGSTISHFSDRFSQPIFLFIWMPQKGCVTI